MLSLSLSFFKSYKQRFKVFNLFSFLGHYYFFQGSNILEYDAASLHVTRRLKSSIMLGC